MFNDRGELIANPAQRYAFTSQSIALRPDGTFAVALAREASPGNWLPTGGAGRLALMFTTFDAGTPMLGKPARGTQAAARHPPGAMPMNIRDKLKDANWQLILAAPVAAGILHICATLAAPYLTAASAYSRLAPALPVNNMQVLSACRARLPSRCRSCRRTRAMPCAASTPPTAP